MTKPRRHMTALQIAHERIAELEDEVRRVTADVAAQVKHADEVIAATKELRESRNDWQRRYHALKTQVDTAEAKRQADEKQAEKDRRRCTGAFGQHDPFTYCPVHDK